MTYGHTGSRALGPPWSLRLREIQELYVGHYVSCGETESNVSLGIVASSTYSTAQQRLIGFWLAPHVKERVFDIMAEFVREQEIPLTLSKKF